MNKMTPTQEVNNEPLTGKKLLQTAVNQILAHPETWNQAEYHSECGTMHCIAGWCQILGGRPANIASTLYDSERLLGISRKESLWIFSKDRSLLEIYNFAKNFNRVGFDHDGFNRAGFDRAGFDHDGFNRDGFDHDGFNRDGFDRAGFDHDGFYRSGFNRPGFDYDGHQLKPFVIIHGDKMRD
jgi:hypothetical protein